jgi:hypothetical protein
VQRFDQIHRVKSEVAVEPATTYLERVFSFKEAFTEIYFLTLINKKVNQVAS